MTKRNKYLRLIGDTGIFAVGNLIQKFVAFLLVPVYTSILTTSEFGTADLLNSLTELIYPIITLSVYEAVFRFAISKDENYKKLLSNGMFALCVGAVISIISGILISLTTGFEYIWYFLSLLIANSIRMIFAFFVRGTGNVKHFAISGIIGAVVLCVSNVIFLSVLRMGAEGYLVSLFLSHISSAAFLFFAAKLYKYIKIMHVDFSYLKVMLAFSIPMVFHTSSAWLINISGRYIILFFAGTGVVGLYSAAIKLPTIINTVSAIFSQAWQFNASLESEQEHRDEYYTNIFCIYSAFLMLFTSLVICLLPLISKLLLKGEFYAAREYLPLMVLTAMFTCYSTFFGAFYIALKRSRPLMYITFISAAVNVSLCFLLVPEIGIWGAVIAGNISYICVIVIRMIDISKYYKIKKDWKVIVPSLAVIGLQIFLVTAEKSFSMEVSAALLVLLAIIYAIYYRVRIKKIAGLCLGCLRRK